ncbi:MAG TPA: hypothetical protein PKE47_16110, partial [Verrucomicrobiota bacterium]|nr:hypothetical protein [Verrucomicrobiota bacterium]
MNRCWRVLRTALALAGAAAGARATAAGGDRWLEPPGLFPEGAPAARVAAAEAEGFAGAAVKGRLRVTWHPPAP